MTMNTTVRARINQQLKGEVEEILKHIGLTTSQAIILFMKRIKYEKGIPFELRVPNAQTLKAMKEAENEIGELIGFDEFVEESKKYAKAL